MHEKIDDAYEREKEYMDRPILYVNACVRKESRTRTLAEKLLSKLDKPFEEIRLDYAGQKDFFM